MGDKIEARPAVKAVVSSTTEKNILPISSLERIVIAATENNDRTDSGERVGAAQSIGLRTAVVGGAVRRGSCANTKVDRCCLADEAVNDIVHAAATAKRIVAAAAEKQIIAKTTRE